MRADKAGTAQDEQIMLYLAYLVLVVALVVTIRTRCRLMRWLAVPWLILAPLLSRWVWQTGNNSLRVLLPLWFVAIIGIEEWLNEARAKSATG